MTEIISVPPDDPNIAAEEFKNKVFAAAELSIEWATAPLVHLDKITGQAVDIRTGVLIEIAEMRILEGKCHP
jgi:hypothetical protein